MMKTMKNNIHSCLDKPGFISVFELKKNFWIMESGSMIDAIAERIYYCPYCAHELSWSCSHEWEFKEIYDENQIKHEIKKCSSCGISKYD